MNRRKGLSTKISPNDQTIIKYVYYNYDPEEIEMIKFAFQIGATCLKGNKAGEIVMKNDKKLSAEGNVKEKEEVKN